MRMDKCITEIHELGIGVNMTQIKELTVKFSDVASTTSPITRSQKMLMVSCLYQNTVKSKLARLAELVILWHKSLYNCPNANSGKGRRKPKQLIHLSMRPKSKFN
jgi:hypothetical protein